MTTLRNFAVNSKIGGESRLDTLPLSFKLIEQRRDYLIEYQRDILSELEKVKPKLHKEDQILVNAIRRRIDLPKYQTNTGIIKPLLKVCVKISTRADPHQLPLMKGGLLHTIKEACEKWPNGLHWFMSQMVGKLARSCGPDMHNLLREAGFMELMMNGLVYETILARREEMVSTMWILARNTTDKQMEPYSERLSLYQLFKVMTAAVQADQTGTTCRLLSILIRDAQYHRAIDPVLLRDLIP